MATQPRAPEETVAVAVIQGDFPSQKKWLSSRASILKRYSEYSRAAAADGAEIILWPESAFPDPILDEAYEAYAVELRSLAEECDATLLVGAYERDPKTGDCYNSLVAFLPDGSVSDTVYRKMHLVPFGEYLPVQPPIPTLAELASLFEYLTPGETVTVFDFPVASIGTLICFDSIYEELARESVRNGAQFLGIATNDSWFGDSAALYEHLGQAQLRAIENGRWVARAANTGVSAFVTPTGAITCSLKPLTGGYLVENLELRKDQTLYTKIGNGFVYVCIGLVLIGVLSAGADREITSPLPTA
jgi:apolipoprotein N-acyltransferase